MKEQRKLIKKHLPKDSQLEKLDSIPPLKPKVLELYVRLQKFNKHKVKLPMEDLNLPLQGPFKFSHESIYYG